MSLFGRERERGHGARRPRVWGCADSSEGFAGLEALEPRTMADATIVNAISNVTVLQGASPTMISLDGRYEDPNIVMVRVTLSLGGVATTFDLALFQEDTPITVANFLSYVNQGNYNNTIIHRSVFNQNGSSFVIQGGGYTLPTQNVDTSTSPPPPAATPQSVTSHGTIVSEAGFSNVTGTIAMALFGGNVNSATSEWYINMGQNTFLDDPGYTVFGVVVNGIANVQAVTQLSTYDAGGYYGVGALNNLPLGGGFPETQIPPYTVRPSHFVAVQSMAVVTDVPTTRVTVTSSNPALVTGTVDANNNLVLTYGANQYGTATVTVRVYSPNYSTVDDVFTVNVQAPPGAAALVGRANVVVGRTLWLNAVGATDADGTVAHVRFYYDTDGDGLLDTDLDTLLGDDTGAGNGWVLGVNTTGMAAGPHRFFVVIEDNEELRSGVFTTVVTLREAPAIGLVEADQPSFSAGSLYTFGIHGVDDGGSVRLVSVYLDSNGNGELGAGDRRLGTAVFSVDEARWYFTGSTNALAGGANTLLVRVIDQHGGMSQVGLVVVNVG